MVRSGAVRGIVGVMLMAVLVGCTDTSSGTGQSTDGTPAPGQTTAPIKPRPPTVWQKTLSRVGSDGHLDKAAALTAFSLAVGSLPGVTRPTGPTDDITSGTIAVSAVLRHWPELTEPQRQAVLGALDTDVVPTPGAGSGAVAGGRTQPAKPKPPRNPNLGCHLKDAAGTGAYRRMIDEAKDRIAEKLGRPLRLNLAVTADTTNKLEGNSAMYTAPCVGLQDPNYVNGRFTGCTIHVKPVLSLQRHNEPEVRGTLIHELMHCFMFDKFGRQESSLPRWFAEGGPDWVQSVLGPSNFGISDVWVKYLNTPLVPLTRRSYDGIGFFVHLAESGVNPWDVIDRTGTALLRGGIAAGWQAAGVGEAFLDSWGSGFVQGRYPGSAWTSTGPNLPPYRPPLLKGPVSQGGKPLAVQVAPTAAESVRLHIDADVVEVAPSAGAKGRISLGGGADSSLQAAASNTYCTLSPSQCRCPPDSLHADKKFTHMDRAEQFLGITGGLKAAAVQVSGQSLEEFCKDQLMVGTWRTTAIRSHADIGPLKWDLSGGGAGVVVKIDRKGNLTASYGGMHPLSYTMHSGAIVGQRGSVTCSGSEGGTVKLPPAKATTGAWTFKSGQYGLTGSVTLSWPKSNGAMDFGPDKGGCAVGAFPRGVPLTGTFRLTGKNKLSISYATRGSTGGQQGGWSGAWQLVRVGPPRR